MCNARRQRALRVLVGMLDACTQVGWELHEARQQVETPSLFQDINGVALFYTFGLVAGSHMHTPQKLPRYGHSYACVARDSAGGCAVCSFFL